MAQPAAEATGEPTFAAEAIKPGAPLRIVVYGDMRFTDPADTSNTNPRVRKWLVEQIAREKPDALFLSGDLPFKGGKKEDWMVYRKETAPWTTAHLRVYPTIGNHELVPLERPGLANYFAEFPWLGQRRWYSAQIGCVYLIALDSNTGDTAMAFDPGTPQREWLEAQLKNLPPEIDFVFFLLHMPLLNDIQSEVIVDLPESAEMKLRTFLESASLKSRAKFVVVSGHIHNYERFEKAGISYIVTGGGGAKPYPIYARSREDLYHDAGFPNFHYLVFSITSGRADATMYRVADPKAANLSVEAKDRFSLAPK